MEKNIHEMYGYFTTDVILKNPQGKYFHEKNEIYGNIPENMEVLENIHA
jgi:hypothetical protein